METVIIKQAKVFCPYCHETHALDLVAHRQVRHFDGRHVRYNTYSYRCALTNQCFETLRMKEDNEARLREAMRCALHYRE